MIGTNRLICHPLHVLHASVLALLWRHGLPDANKARKYYQEILGSGRVTVRAIDSIYDQVLQRVTRDLTEYERRGLPLSDLRTDIANIINAIMKKEHLWYPSRRAHLEPLVRDLARSHEISFTDGLMVPLAELVGIPVLVADEELYRKLKAVESSRPNFRVDWLRNLNLDDITK